MELQLTFGDGKVSFDNLKMFFDDISLLAQKYNIPIISMPQKQNNDVKIVKAVAKKMSPLEIAFSKLPEIVNESAYCYVSRKKMERMIEMYLDGMSVAKIAKKVSVSEPTVTKYLKMTEVFSPYDPRVPANAVFVERKGYTLTKDVIDDVRRLALEGNSRTAITKATGVSDNTICKYTKDLNIDWGKFMSRHNQKGSNVSRRETVAKVNFSNVPQDKKLYLSICHDYFNLEMTEIDVAKKHGVSVTTVGRYKRRYRLSNKV